MFGKEIKIGVTKTLSPFYFENLDHSRFEGLVRQLIYNYKDWQNIEVTVGAGSDDGFDVHAWERTEFLTGDFRDDSRGPSSRGKQWIVQCRRDKEVDSSYIEDIVDESIPKSNPPYGYILVAPADFSRKTFETFKEELRAKGVTEFHLWGKQELEDMLSMPKYDHILFTFFGISLVTRRRSRAEEINFAVKNKNRLMDILGNTGLNRMNSSSVLVRDFRDDCYPDRDKCGNFAKSPRWAEHVVAGFHPSGLKLRYRRYYAYVDHENKQYDYTDSVDLIARESEQEILAGEEQKDRLERVEDFWKHLPARNKAKLVADGLIPFERMLIIDEKGDSLYNFPHIFVEYDWQKGPFSELWTNIETASGSTLLQKDKYKRIKFFPSKFPEAKEGHVYRNNKVVWNERTYGDFRAGRVDTLFDVDGKYAFLNVRDIVLVACDDGRKPEELFMGITHKFSTTVDKYISEKYHSNTRADIERQIGRPVKDDDRLYVFEIEKKVLVPESVSGR